MQPVNHSQLFKDVCEFYDILSVSKCGPYAEAPQSLSLDTRDGRSLHGRYTESYCPFGKDRFATGAATVITFFDFDENEIEHQRMLSLALLKLRSVLSNLEKEIFYKSKLMAYDSPYFIASTENTKHCLQQYLLNLYRGTVGGLLDLDFTKWYFFEMDVDRKGDELKHYGRFLFNLQDQFSDSLKEQEIKRRIRMMEKTAKKHKFSEERIQKCKEMILDPVCYQDRRFIEITLLEEFHLEEEEFQKLKKLINDYGFSVSIHDTRKEYPDNRIPELSLRELEERIVIK